MYMGRELPEQHELVTGGGFHDSANASSTNREMVFMRSHKKVDTRLILRSYDAVNEFYQRVVVICRYTDVMLPLVHFIFRIANRSVDDIWNSYKHKVFSNTYYC